MSRPAEQLSGITRTDLRRHDLSASGREIIRNRVGISPEAPLVKHGHPDEEIIHVLEGARVPDRRRAAQTVKASEALTVAAETIHAIKNVGR